MPYYQQRGQLPAKRHTAYRKPDGSLYAEHLMGTLGFDGPASLLYHIHRPTQILNSSLFAPVVLEEETDRSVRMRHFLTSHIQTSTSITLIGSLFFSMTTSLSHLCDQRIPTIFSSEMVRQIRCTTSVRVREF